MTKIGVAASIGRPVAQLVEELRDSFPGVGFLPATNPEEAVVHIRDADAFVGLPTREVYLTAQKLRWVHCLGTGIEGFVAIPELANGDVVLTNARGPHTTSMADHVFAMMLTFAHRLQDLWEDQRAHRWEPHKYDESYLELGGRTMGNSSLTASVLYTTARSLHPPLHPTTWLRESWRPTGSSVR